MCDRQTIGVTSIFKTIRSAAALVRMLPTLDLRCEENAERRKWSWFALTELLKLQESGSFPMSLVKIKGAQILFYLLFIMKRESES